MVYIKSYRRRKNALAAIARGHKKTRSEERVSGLLKLPLLGEAVAAINRAAFGGLKRHFAGLPAGSANGVEHLTLRTPRVFAGVTARFASLGLVHEPFFFVEILFACSKHEFLPAVLTDQCFVLMHLGIPRLNKICLDRTGQALTLSIEETSSVVNCFLMENRKIRKKIVSRGATLFLAAFCPESAGMRAAASAARTDAAGIYGNQLAAGRFAAPAPAAAARIPDPAAAPDATAAVITAHTVPSFLGGCYMVCSHDKRC